MSFELECTKLHETENAVLVRNIDCEDIWFPLSQVESMHFNTVTGVGSIIVTDWIAEQKGLR